MSIANDAASLPVAYVSICRWADDSARRQKAGVPEDVVFKTKPMLAFDQLIAACKAGFPRGVLLMDTGYGADTKLRSGVTALGLTCAAGNMPRTSMWTRDNPPPSPRAWSGRGRPPKLIRRDREHQPASARTLAIFMGAHHFAATASSSSNHSVRAIARTATRVDAGCSAGRYLRRTLRTTSAWRSSTM